MHPRPKCWKPLRIHPRSAELLSQVMESSPTPAMAPGPALRLIRTNLRMSQAQLARRSGVPQAHIARLESGTVDAQWKTWEKLFAGMQCRLALRVQAEGGLAAILEDRILLTARLKQMQSDRLFPNGPKSEAERRQNLQFRIEMLRDVHTSEIWEVE